MLKGAILHRLVLLHTDPQLVEVARCRLEVLRLQAVISTEARVEARPEAALSKEVLPGLALPLLLVVP